MQLLPKTTITAKEEPAASVPSSANGTDTATACLKPYKHGSSPLRNFLSLASTALKGAALTTALSAVLCSCGTEERRSPVPDSQVYFRTTYDDYIKLQNIGSFRTYENGIGIYPTNTKLGYSGLVIFRDFDGKIRCCDLCCPFEASRLTKVTVTSGLMAECKQCGSVFDLTFGLCVPTHGPAKKPLKVYTHCTDNGSTITVSY